jgi:beta-lactamase regulating signal transducer with metallopeptidase domain
MPIELLSQLTSAAIRAAGLGLVAFTGLLLFRIRSSTARHATWTLVLAGMLLQIPLGVLAPAVPVKAPPTLPTRLQPRTIDSARMILHAAPASHLRTQPKAHHISSSGIIASLYLAISMLLFVRMALGSWGLHRMLRSATPIDDLRSGVFESDLLASPGSVGWLRAKIVLPQTWRDWDAAKLRAVLAHERAHIRRRDWLIRVASHVNVCIFWFHPMAWWMERELARLAEEACDDAALSELDDREEYAATLIEIARAVCADTRVLNWRVISMAKNSNVIRRVNRILNRRTQVPKSLGRFAWVTLFACSMPVIYLSAALTLTPVVPSFPVKAAELPLFPERKFPVTLIAQAIPNRPSPPRREDPPITICILLDDSGSMRDKREAVKAAALAVVKSLRPGDEICIVDFNDEAYLDLDFTSDISKVEETIAHYEARGGTAMRDAIRMSIEHIEQKGKNDRKVLVLVTEGNDNASAVSQQDLVAEVRNSGVPIYSIGLFSENESPGAVRGRYALRQLTKASRGQDFYPMDLTALEIISPEIAAAVRRQ